MHKKVEKGIYSYGDYYTVRSPKYLGKFQTLAEAREARNEALKVQKSGLRQGIPVTYKGVFLCKVPSEAIAASVIEAASILYEKYAKNPGSEFYGKN